MTEAETRTIVIGGSDEDLSLIDEILGRQSATHPESQLLPLSDDTLHLLEDSRPDIVLLVAGASRTSALDFVRRMVASRPDIPLLVLHRSGDPELHSRSLEAGAFDCLRLDRDSGRVLERIIRYARDRRGLRRSEARLRALVGVAREVLSVIDGEGVIRYSSPSVQRILGFSPSEREGMSAVGEIHPDDRERALAELERVARDPDHRPEGRFRVRRRDGSWSIQDIVAENYLDDPDIDGIVISGWDVTEQVRREERIQFQATLMQAVGQAVIATDLAGTIIYWNRAAEELYGWTRDEVLGRNIIGVATPPEMHDRAEAIMESIRKDGRGTGELEVQRKDGSTFLAFVTDSPVHDSDGELIGIVGTSSDVSSLKKTEWALRERVKELRTLYTVNQLINQSEVSLDERLQRVVEALPGGWLRPELTEARLVLHDSVVTTSGFRETPSMQSATIGPTDRPLGRIDIAVTEDLPEQDGGPFLHEEEELLVASARAVEEAMHRQRLTRLVEQTIASLEEAVLIIENDGGGPRIREANPAAERIFGYTSEELAGGTVDIADLFANEHEFRRFQARRPVAMKLSGGFRGALPMRRKDGSVFPAEQTVTLLEPERGPEAGEVFTARDISQRRRAEERFGVLSREVADHIYVLNEDFSVQYSTPSVERLAGVPKEEFERLTGPELMEIVHPDDRERIRQAMFDFVSDKDTRQQAINSYRIVKPSGEIRHVEALVRNLLDNPVLEGIVVTTRDVTERVELEKRMRQGQKMEAVGRLAGGIAHDFNNILTVIRSQTDLLMLEPPDPEGLVKELEVVQSSVERAATLTSQLLAFSRDQILRPRIVDLSEVVRSLGQLVDRMIGEDVSLEYDLPDDLPPITVDPAQLEQAVMNLAVNARDAMPSGGTLSLSAYRQESIRPSTGSRDETTADVERMVRTVLRVSDTGAGMDEETRARIFEPFYTTKAKGKGTGLGLSMVYGFVEQSGGSIRVESGPNEGTSFYLSFPAAEDAPSRAPARPASRRITHELEGAVLLVEDDPAVQRATRRILEGSGLVVTAVGDAEGGYELVEVGREFDMLLTDLVLPGMNGRELVAMVRDSRPDLPILVMSGYAEGPSGQELNLPEGVGFIQKPFTRDELMEEVERTLGGGDAGPGATTGPGRNSGDEEAL